MKIKSAALIALILYATGAYAFSEPGQVENKNCYAIVQDNNADFVFPRTVKKQWTWFNKEIKDNVLEYSWEVQLQDGHNPLDFGVYLFKFPGEKEVKGSLEQLLNEAQFSVFEQEARSNGRTGAKIREDLIITSKLIDGRVVIRIRDKETFARIFANKPGVARFIMRQPFDGPFTCDATIEYLDQTGQQVDTRNIKTSPVTH